ncbi:hypothetical protein RMN57_21685 [Kitasatospora sp. CM 4170]|uniref:Tellurite resistance protein TerB n=1 Tax=Kitasatospora aburaviensis TaxID=67265 RepID=A0ABW1F8Q4_9ACTN|nr:hypothetical protein [Kitasatospora sp. CM 4170]WNM47129.1 hypothetical protein RMN57_21685 [Kitasatospora sp. CM 4170]
MAGKVRRAGSAAAAVHAAQRVAAAVLPGVGVLGLLLFSLGREHAWQALGGGLVVAGASTVLGGALGFLFGVPRVRGGSGPGGEAHGSYAPNTNLEQVSDWLTKVLLGVGLTQLGSLGERMHQLGSALAPALGGAEGAVPFAAALVLYFLVLGFLAGWLVTRLALPQVLSDADEALDLFLAGQDRDRRGDKVGADDLRVRAMQQLGLLGGAADRAEEPARRPSAGAVPGPATVMAEVRSAARRSALTADQVRELFADGDEGRRLQALALMQGDPALADLPGVLDAIEHPRSGFEQYNALLAARGLLNVLPAAEAQRLRDALAGQLVAADGIPYGSDRSWLAEKILSRLEAPALPPQQQISLPQQAGPAGEAPAQAQAGPEPSQAQAEPSQAPRP